MSNMRECKETFTHYCKARIPFVVIETIETTRALELVKSVTESMSLNGVYVHSISKGMCELSSGREVDEDTTLPGALTFIAEQMKRKQQLTFVLTEATDLDKESTDTRQLLGAINVAIETGGMIVAITSSSIWNQLQRTGMRLTLDFPDEQEMYAIINDMLDGYRGAMRIDWDQNDMRVASQLLAGVSQIEAENVIASLLANGRIDRQDLDELRFVKDRLFSNISGLERIKTSPRDGDVGGLNGLQTWLDERQRLLLDPDIRQRMSQRGLPPPRGVLLVGVPGCGKSVSAKAIAARWKMPLYRLDFATVQGSYVGQSEKQLKDALTTAEQVSPCILWVDEIEKGLSGATGGGDGGVSTRMVGQFLFWLQESKKLVFVVATANDVSQLPAELLRRGRFDEIFFVDLPTLEERKVILRMHYRNYVGEEMSPMLLEQLAQISEGFAGADLESAMRDAAYHMETTGQRMADQDILSMVANIIPLSRTNPEKIEAIRAWGRERAVPASGRSIGGGDAAAQQKGRRILDFRG